MKYKTLCESEPTNYIIDGDNTLFWKKIGGDLTGSPRNYDYNFRCMNMDITSLKGAPFQVGGSFDCSSNELVTLDGAPETVGGHFWCSHNELTTLKGGPQYVNGMYIANNNKIEVIEGLPRIIHGTLDLRRNNIMSIAGLPSIIEEELDLSQNKISSILGIEDILVKVKLLNLQNNPITEGGLGLLFINGLEEISGSGEFKKAIDIIEDYLNNGRIKDAEVYECQQKLVDAGLEAYAQI